MTLFGSPQGLYSSPQGMFGSPQKVSGSQQGVCWRLRGLVGNPQELIGSPQGLVGSHTGAGWESRTCPGRVYDWPGLTTDLSRTCVEPEHSFKSMFWFKIMSRIMVHNSVELCLINAD